MLVVIDVGNTNIVIGVYKNEILLQSWRMGADRDKTADEFGMFFAGLFQFDKLNINDVTDVIISSVVPPIMFSLERSVRKYFKRDPIIVEVSKSGMPVKYCNPKELGADRIVNAVAAYEKVKGPVVIIDFGTATTFCAVNGEGEYLGGSIAPGIKISADALYNKAAKLPKIELALPEKVISNETAEAMQIGIIFGYIGLVDHIVRNMKKEMNSPDAKVIATGGLATLIASKSETIDEVDGILTLEGLMILHKRIKGTLPAK